MRRLYEPVVRNALRDPTAQEVPTARRYEPVPTAVMVASMALEITLLGPPRVTRDGEPVVFETRKSMALLAHLALSEHPRSRDALCGLLYPAHDPERARGALRRTLSTLRKGIGSERIDTSGDSIALRRAAGLDLDVARFRGLAAEGGSEASLGTAVALYGGAFMEGFSLRDSPEFEDWQLATANALEGELTAALRHLVEQLIAAGDLERALPRARRWLELDPLHEPAHRALIRLYAWSGDRAAALEQYRACVRTLSQELGVAPLLETAALYEQVNDGELAPPAATAPPSAPSGAARVGHRGRLPLIGRAEQLTALIDAHADACPDGAVAVIEGEAGIGKTRLADELAAHARGSGAIVLTARCHDDEAGIPYGPVVELLRAAVGGGGEPPDWPATLVPQRLADASLLLPELASLHADARDALPLAGPEAQVRLLEGVAAVISAACRGPVPGVVVLDDIHAADEATVDAITYLGRRLTGRAMLLVVSWRSEAMPPGHRLRRLTGDLARAGRATIVSPRRLDGGEVARLVRAAHPAGSSPELEQRVHFESEGLPLFVTEYLAALRGGGEPAGEATSPELRGLLDARLAGLGDVARQILGAAAAIGRSFDFDAVRLASGRSDEETVGALEELVAHGVVRELAGAEPAYDFSHDKLRALVYERTGLARRRLLHRRIAAALSADRRAGDRAGLIAGHLRMAGDHTGAGRAHRIAAEHAASLYAHADALEHLEAALALGDPDAAAVHERLGDLRTLIGDYAGALAGYEAAAAFCAPAARAAIEHKTGNVHLRRGEWERAEARLLAALAAAPDDALGLRARIQADLGLTLHRAGGSERAVTLTRESLELAVAADDRQAQAQAHNMLGVLARSDGARAAAIEHLQRSLELAQELGDPAAQAAALNNLALVHRDVAELPAALELTERALVLCVRYGDRHREAALENNLADLHHAGGDEDGAMVHLKRAVAIFSEVGADEATRLPEIWKLVSW